MNISSATIEDAAAIFNLQRPNERLGYRPFRRQPVNQKLTMVYLEKVVAPNMRGDVEPTACLKCPKG